MKRRQFLLLTLTAPLALRRVLADTSAPRAASALAPGPTLFIIKPRASEERLARGKLFGEFLTDVPERHLAPLAQMALVAVTMDELRAAFPVGRGEPLVVYVDARRDLVVRRLEAERGEHPDIERLIGFLRELAPDARDAAAGHAARARYTRELPGARWAEITGCGTLVPGEEDQMPDCGMGHTGARGRRFLWFFAKGEKRPM